MNPLNHQDVGVDIVRIGRFKKLANDEKFLVRVFNPEELEFLEKLKHPENRIAGRWAAKEAVSKALGCGIGEKLGFKDITILNDPSGKPFVTLSRKTNEKFNFPEISLSISHDGDYAIAFVIATYLS